VPAPERARRRRAFGLAAGVLLAGVAAAAAQEAQQLDELERTLAADRARLEQLERQQSAIGDEIATLQSELVEQAARAQSLEAKLTGLDGQLAELTNDETAKSVELAMRRQQLDASLAALGWLAMQPPATLLLGEGDTSDRVRGATLVTMAVPALQARALDLKRDLAALDALRQEIALRRVELTEETEALGVANARIAALIEERGALEAATAKERAAQAERVAALAAEARDLRDLLKKLAAMTPPPEPESEPGDAVQTAAAVPAGVMRDFPDAPGGVTPPAQGALLVRYGERPGEEPESRGVTLATRPAAQVVAPFDGQVVFQGPFRGYGPILIIEHGGGYHSLLAGLGRIDATVGQWLKQGEPVGQMSPETGDASPKLYIELRRGGQPVDPAPWLGLTDN
jgi:septal ring factor EnvC (AmiA/AmiB activator)